MKSITESIKGGSGAMFNITQAGSSGGAAYATVDTGEPMHIYRHGFLTYGRYNEAIFLVAFNKVEDIQDLLDTDDDEYGNLLNMKPQESKTIRGELFVKLW